MRAAGAPARSDIRHGDCLDALRAIGAGVADLVYMDPPFNTGKRQGRRGEAFDDSWRDTATYLAFLRPRIEASIDSLTPDGSVLVHCDWRMCHHLRLLLDELLGPSRFVNHLIWRYGLGGSSPRRFARKHDDILFYARSERHWFDPPRIPATSMRMRGMTKKATDVLDIPSINNMGLERTGYPTQKPLALLRLLVSACCPPGGLVIDPFCGSGTTIVAAVETGRRGIGVDASRRAVTIAKARLCEALSNASDDSSIPA